MLDTLLYGFIYNLPLILIKVLWCGSSHYDFMTSIFILKFHFKCWGLFFKISKMQLLLMVPVFYSHTAWEPITTEAPNITH